MEQILDMIAKWDRLGQGLFFLIVIGAVLGIIHQLGYFLTVLIRGWPANHPKPPGL